MSLVESQSRACACAAYLLHTASVPPQKTSTKCVTHRKPIHIYMIRKQVCVCMCVFAANLLRIANVSPTDSRYMDDVKADVCVCVQPTCCAQPMCPRQTAGGEWRRGGGGCAPTSMAAAARCGRRPSTPACRARPSPRLPSGPTAPQASCS